VQSAFPIVVFGAVAFSLVMSVGFLLSRSSLYDQIGQGQLTREGDSGGGTPIAGGPAADSPATRLEREREIRQMLSARSARLVSRGEPALDIDAEVARLMQPPQQASAEDEGLTREVRQLVVARNERRLRQGLEPLEVEAEVTRTLEELNP
jgi:hypothetical protein